MQPHPPIADHHPNGFHSLHTSSRPANRPPQALEGSDAAAAATIALEVKTSPALAFPVNRLELSTYRVREKKTKYRPLLGAAVDDPSDSCRSCWNHLDGSARKREPSWNICSQLFALSRYCIVSVPSWVCSPLSITNRWHCNGCGSSATLYSVAGLIAFKTFAHAFLYLIP